VIFYFHYSEILVELQEETLKRVNFLHQSVKKMGVLGQKTKKALTNKEKSAIIPF
jgi:hypothetical protein